MLILQVPQDDDVTKIFPEISNQLLYHSLRFSVEFEKEILHQILDLMNDQLLLFVLYHKYQMDFEK
jgi:hypothetical protein